MDLKSKPDGLSSAGPGSASRPPVATPPVEVAPGNGLAAPAPALTASAPALSSPAPGLASPAPVAPAAAPAEAAPSAMKRKLDRLSGAGLSPGRPSPRPAPPVSNAESTNPAPAQLALSPEQHARTAHLASPVEAGSSGHLAAPAGAVPAGPAATDGPASALSPEEQEKQARISRLRRAMETVNLKHLTAPPASAPKPERAAEPVVEVQGELAVESRTTEHGVLHVADRLFAADHRHGEAPVAAALAADPSHVATLALDPAFAGVDLARMLLVDTETTGLAGGAGTLPFLIGLGWFEAGALRLHQLFLRRPGEEVPMLRFLAERLRDASCLVSYNGKTFDWPLLRTRFVMNRLPVPAPPPHLDLLHIARRVFKHREGGARLVRVEEEVLGHRRVGDVDGSLIPELYFRFLRGGSGAALTPVLEHNAHDLVLLAALLGRLAHGLKDGAEEMDPRDRLGLAEVASRAEWVDRALELARSVTRGSTGTLAADAWTLTAWMLRRQNDARGAAEAFTVALEHADRKRAPALHFALAKLYEHTLRNLPLALQHARHTASAESPAEQAKRIARLERRMTGQGALPMD